MSSTALPHSMLLEDANDLCDFLDRTGRTVPPEKWVPEFAAAVQDAIDSKANEGLL